jgi:hypothetical protein
MRTTHRRYWVFFLLFLFGAIAYLDRVNMSVAGKPIAHEFGLSPIELGYLFSSFLWAYVLMMLPGGRLIDRWGTHVMAPVPPLYGRGRRWRPGWSAASRRCWPCGSVWESARRPSRRFPMAAFGRGRPIPSAVPPLPRSRPGPASGRRSARRPWPAPTAQASASAAGCDGGRLKGRKL